MTTIKKMHLHGFKSFAKPIDLDFGNNFNVILGPNGSGKTTIFNMITGFIAPDRGDIHFKGEPIAGLQPHEIANLGIRKLADFRFTGDQELFVFESRERIFKKLSAAFIQKPVLLTKIKGI